MYIISGLLCIKKKKTHLLEQVFTIFGTYIEYTSFPIKAHWFDFKCFQMYAFVAQEIAFWNLWPA